MKNKHTTDTSCSRMNGKIVIAVMRYIKCNLQCFFCFVLVLFSSLRFGFMESMRNKVDGGWEIHVPYSK